MNYHLFVMILPLVIITTFTTLTIGAFGQTSNSTLQEKQILNKTESQQPSEEQNQGLDKEIIKVSSTEFNELLNEIKASMNLIQQKKYDDATSRLGLAIIEILNSTHQYQELVQFASSQYINKIEQQQFNDEKEE